MNILPCILDIIYLSKAVFLHLINSCSIFVLLHYFEFILAQSVSTALLYFPMPPKDTVISFSMHTYPVPECVRALCSPQIMTHTVQLSLVSSTNKLGVTFRSVQNLNPQAFLSESKCHPLFNLLFRVSGVRLVSRLMNDKRLTHAQFPGLEAPVKSVMTLVGRLSVSKIAC